MKLLFDEISSGGNGGNVANADLLVGGLSAPAMVFVTACGRGNYNNPGVESNAGILLTVRAKGKEVASDSFEAQSYTINFQTTATMMFMLEQGKGEQVTANVSWTGTNQVRNASVELHVVALEIEP